MRDHDQRSRRSASAAILAITLLAAISTARQAHAVKVVCTLPAYSAIAREIAGPDATVQSIARPDEDAHFVKPKPSLALMLRDADLFVTTGLDLELWAPTLVDKSGNRRILDAQPGFVKASQGVQLLDVPTSLDRSAGDVHIYGNPHIFTSPINAKTIAANIAAGLERVDPGQASDYRRRLDDFRHRIDVALYGEPLLAVLDSATLDALATSGKLVSFLESQQVDGRPLIDRLGGWLGRGLAYRDQPIVAYHKNWIYFTQLFGLRVVDYVEPKPGIPPSARHVHELIDTISRQGIRALLVATYFDERQPQAIAQRTGCQVVYVSLGVEPPKSYFDLVDVWVGGLADVFAKEAGS